MRSTLPRLLEAIRHQLWLGPMIAAVLAAVGAEIVVAVEGQGLIGLPYTVDAASAQAVLSAISSAMITFTALVFSVTMLVLQQASAQLSPRVTRTFLRDRFNQAVLSLFVATFVFSLLVLADTSDDSVPQLGLAISLLLVLAAVLVFVVYVDHTANAIRASSVIEAIAAETGGVLARLEDGDSNAERGDGGSAVDDLPGVTAVVRSPHRSGYVVSIDEARLARIATSSGHIIEVLVPPGTYVVSGEPLLALRGEGPGADDAAEAIDVGSERSMAQDPLFGFRQLVDVALRALSPGTNDPATAVQVIERLHGLLRQAMSLELASPALIHDGEQLRLVIPGPDWDAYVSAAVDEIDEAGGTSTLIRRTLRGALLALAEDAEPDRLPALRRALARLHDESDTAPNHGPGD